MNVIFLDVDGVLNNRYTTLRTLTGFPFVDDYLVQRIARIVQKTNAQIVLSSTWRLDWHQEDESLNGSDFVELRDVLGQNGLEIFDRTGEEIPFEREREIQEYLNSHSEITNFVIIDDLDLEEYFPNHCIWANPSLGITSQQVLEAINILNF